MIDVLAVMNAAQWFFVGMGVVVEAVIIWAWRAS